MKLMLTKRPNSLATLYSAFKSKKYKVRFGSDISELEAEWLGLRLSGRHITAFNNICRLEKTESVSMLYPFTLIYPINLWLISQPQIPVAMFRMLTTRNTTTQYKEIEPELSYQITSRICGQRFIKNGMEFYINSELASGDDLFWANRSTFFVPGRTDTDENEEKPFRLEEVPDAEDHCKWFLPAENRFRFARIMGDSNGIHYSKYYAKMFGYKRDFAQPIRVVSKSVESLPTLSVNGGLRLDVFFKGPVYYNSELTLKNCSTDGSNRFDVYCDGNNRPCISGKLDAL